MIQVARRRVIALALPLLISACAGLQSPPQVASQSPSVAARHRLHETIDLTGRLSVRYQLNGKEEGLHGNFNWSQTIGRTNVTLLSPLGQTMAVITVSPDGATLAQSGQPLRSATNVNALTESTLGWPLPVAGLREWLQGIAIDANGSPFIATPHAPDVTTGDGWYLRYTNWLADDAPAIGRPRRIDLSRYTEQAGNVSIRIIIDTWQTR